MNRSATPTEAIPAVQELRAVGGDDLLREMMRTFVTFAGAQVPRLLEAAHHGDLEIGSRIAHTLKSSARQLGAMPLGEACASAELAARGGDVAGFLRGSEEVVAAFAEARQWMEALAEG